MRYRLWAMVVVCGLLLATLGSQAASAGGPTLTRLRVELWGSGEWQSVRFSDAIIGAHQVIAQSAGSTVERGMSSLVLHGLSGTAVSTTIDVLLEISNPSASAFDVELAKSKIGEAHTKLYRTNTGSTLIHSSNNYQSSGDCTVTSSVSRSSFVAEGYAMPRVDPRRLVLAFYYPWFQAGSFDKGPWYDTPTTAYDTLVPAEVAKQADLAKGAGVDGFVISWDDVGNHTQRFDTAMAAARTRSMVVAPLIELLMWKTSSGFNVPGIVATMKLALQRANDAAFLKVGGRPVLFVFGAFQMSPDVWKGVSTSLNAAGYDPFYIGEPADPAYGFNGAYAYNPNLIDYDGLHQRNAAYMRALRYQAQVNPAVKQGLWAATVSPGQNLSYYNPIFPKNQARGDGDRYNLTWSAAVSTDPEWVLITSWNEWFEATHVVPSEKFGWTAIDQTAGWSAGFHNPGQWGGGESSDGLLSNLPPIPLKLGSSRS
ncbi:MAG: hypothetical protein ACRDJ1_05630 [Actinomycetota bacterium]